MVASWLGMFGFALVSTAIEWCDTPCGHQTCASPFTPEETCDEIARAADIYGTSTPTIWVRWIEAKGKRAIKDSWGRQIAGVTKGQASVEVVWIAKDTPCRTALAHEVRHALLLRDGLDPDAEHKDPAWKAFGGCPK
jgi:hypothetical protein